MFASKTHERIYHIYKSVDKKFKLNQEILCNSNIINDSQSQLLPQSQINKLFKNQLYEKPKKTLSILHHSKSKVTIKIPQLIRYQNKRSISNISSSFNKTNNMSRQRSKVFKYKSAFNRSKSLVNISDQTEKGSSINKLRKRKATLDIGSNKTNYKFSIGPSRLLKANLSHKQINLFTAGLKTKVKRSSIIDRFMFKLVNPDAVIEDYYAVHESRAIDHYAMFKRQLIKTTRKMTKIVDSVQKTASLNESMMKIHIHNIGREFRNVSKCKTSSNIYKSC